MTWSTVLSDEAAWPESPPVCSPAPSCKITDRNDTRRTEIRRAAARLIAEKGVLKATMRGIGRTIRLRGASLYYYFDTRESLHAEIMLEHLHRLARDVGTSFDATET